MEEEVPAIIVWGCGVKVVTTVTEEACWPSPKSLWLKVKRRVSYIEVLVEFVPVVINR